MLPHSKFLNGIFNQSKWDDGKIVAAASSHPIEMSFSLHDERVNQPQRIFIFYECAHIQILFDGIRDCCCHSHPQRDNRETDLTEKNNSSKCNSTDAII